MIHKATSINWEPFRASGPDEVAPRLIQLNHDERDSIFIDPVTQQIYRLDRTGPYGVNYQWYRYKAAVI